MINLDVVTKGFYEVWSGDSKISQHSNPYKAAMRAVEEKTTNIDADIFVKQPNMVPVVDGLEQNQDHGIEILTQSEYDNIDPIPNKIYAIKV